MCEDVVEEWRSLSIMKRDSTGDWRVESATTWVHGQFPAQTATEGHAESLATQQQGLVSMSVVHITTREHGDVLVRAAAETTWISRSCA